MGSTSEERAGDILIGIVYVTPQGLSKGMFKADRFVNLFAMKDSRAKRF